MSNQRLRTVMILLVVIAAGLLRADVVETRDGARLVGKVTKIDGGKVFLTTTYAGDLEIKQSEVTGMTTEGPVFVRLDSGTTVQGKVVLESGGAIVVSGADGELRTRMDKVAATWPTSGEDPAVTAMKKAAVEKERRWAYQVGIDVTGKSGNSSSSGVATSFVATLASPQDKLKFYGSYNYAKADGRKSIDESKGGIDYSSFFGDRMGWFVRSELQQDKIALVDLRSTTDFGLTYRFVKNPQQELTGRLGAGYRFENFTNHTSNKGAVLSFGLFHSYQFGKSALLTTDLQYLPAASDFADYRFVHDSGLELPLAASLWKIRFGVNNQYNSRPQSGRENLDTTWYTRLLLIWK
jgi:putative salt-induced outer membrane protein YdiY